VKIYKYDLPIADRQELRLPRGATLLHVGEQSGQLKLWALVNPEAPREPIEVCIAGTGHDWPAGFRHFATVEASYGLVWHVGVEPRKVYRRG